MRGTIGDVSGQRQVFWLTSRAAFYVELDLSLADEKHIHVKNRLLP